MGIVLRIGIYSFFTSRPHSSFASILKATGLILETGVALSCHISSLSITLGVDGSFLELHDLNIFFFFEYYRPFCRMSLKIWSAIWCFIIINFKLYILGRSITEVMLCSSVCISSDGTWRWFVSSFVKLPLTFE